MRIGAESWWRLNPEDVSWVAEWLLAGSFRWLPIGDESLTRADSEPDRARGRWGVTIRVGCAEVRAHLPLRDLARVTAWCHQVTCRELGAPPPPIRASLSALGAALREALDSVDPLAGLGYAAGAPGSRAASDPSEP